MNYPRYPEYKPSGVEWLGEVPAHWGLKRLKYIASHNDDVLSETTDPDYVMQYVDISSVTLANGIEKKEEYTFEKAPSRARRKVRDGDTIVSTVRTYLKAIAPIEAPEDNLVVSTGFAVIRPRVGVVPRYLAYQLQTQGFVDAVVANSVGVSYPAINASQLVTLPALIPSEDEQRAIAAFLDRETARIDALIARKQRLIELLAEKRTALISQAVTKGLNPDAPMKDSGVEWLGDIPAHWRLAPLTKYLESIVDYRGATPQKVVDGVFLITAKNVRAGRIDYECSQEYIDPADFLDVMRRGLPRKGDVLFTMEAPLGEVANVDQEYVALAQRIIKIRGRQQILDNYFLKYWIMGAFFQQDVGSYATGSTAQGIKASKLGYLKCVLPPIEEQIEIVQFVERQIAKLDLLRTEVEGAIEKLKEYRAALIADAVTGKIDVRNLTEEREVA